MKTVLIFSLLLCAAFAAPTEEEQKPLETTEVVQNEEPAVVEVPETRFNFCPPGWFSHGSQCFLLVNNLLSWYKAEEHCNSLGGHLASATSPSQYSFLQQITQTSGLSTAWLGGFNLQGQWMWINRDGFYYTNWQSQSSVSSNACLYLNSASGWRNGGCSHSCRFICSKNAFGC